MRPGHRLIRLSTLLALAAAAAGAPSLAAARGPGEPWLAPVPGEVIRPFDYSADRPFAAGAHRGADLAARRGGLVRSACAGRVLHARAVPRHGRIVTVACGDRRVTYLPLARVAVAAGRRVAAGGPLGTVAGGHGGLHLGVRRAGDPFAYEDPLRWIAGAPRALPVLRPRLPSLRAPAPPVPAPRPASGPAPEFRRPAPAPVLGRPRGRATAVRAPAPWPVWAGVALVLAGCVGSGATAARRRRAHARGVGAPVTHVAG